MRPVSVRERSELNGSSVRGNATGGEAEVLAPPPRRARMGPVAMVRLAHAVLWLLVVGGATSGGLSLLLLAQDAGVEATGTAEPPVASAGAEGFAELFVATYLGRAGRGEEDVLAGLYAGDANLRDVTPGGVYVLRTATVAAEEQVPGYWAVTVAADVLSAVDGVYAPRGVRYYAVGIASDGVDRYVATTLPGLVPAPPALEPPRLAVTALSAPRDEPHVEAAHRFLAALLAGQGELDRYSAPGTAFAPVTPAPFVGVSLQRVGVTERTGGPLWLRVEAAAVDDAGLTHVLHYSLEVAERAGRWEVTALHAAAPLWD